MDTAIVIGIILFIIAAVIIIKLTKKVLKAIFLIASLAAAILIISGFFIIADVKDFKDNFPNQPSLYLFEDKNTLLAGMSVVFGEEEPKPIFITKEQLTSFQASFEKNNLQAIIGNNYKLFILSSNAFKDIDKVKSGDIELSRQEILTLLSSETPLDNFILAQIGEAAPEQQREIYKQKLKQEAGIETDAQFKGVLFMLLFGTAMEKQGPLFLFNQYKQGNIIIYPETTLFKLLKIIPSPLLEKAIIQMKPGE